MSDNNFNPELGQAMFSNTPWQELPLDELTEAALRHLAEEIERVEWNNTQKEFHAPIHNYGTHYETDKFEMHCYCWCDGERHPNGCPPNFIYKPSGFQVCWYKYLGRGSSQNRKLKDGELSALLEDCLESVRAKERDILEEFEEGSPETLPSNNGLGGDKAPMSSGGSKTNGK